jgi:hypothetical protein
MRIEISAQRGPPPSGVVAVDDGRARAFNGLALDHGQQAAAPHLADERAERLEFGGTADE